ncbi:hypothetical protein [Paenibacillus soyae]|uniref:Dockerin domain-containing protein n=1 Tax=Paenibacillus soyae TaxID=2969249 RepID=A0A9X2S9Q4_9BACL|nr:hypothetical protein [Paenibacillus soyae]MCR2805714.1 hypothetical protein [Paenibacillus soyae]
MKNIQRRARMLLAALLAAALLPWSGAMQASASAGGSIEARPFPNDQNVAYAIEFKASEAIPSWSDGGSLTIEFPSAYQLPDGAAFHENTSVSSSLEIPDGTPVYGYPNIVNVSVNAATDSKAVRLGLDEEIPADSIVMVRIWEEVGIGNPDSGSYTFRIGKTGGTLTEIPFTIISGTTVEQFTVESDGNGRYLSGYNGLTESLANYTFRFTPASDLNSGGHIQIRLPFGYLYENQFMYWEPVTIPSNKVAVAMNDVTAAGMLSDAKTIQDEYGYPALSFTVAQAIPADADISIQLSDFLRTPDYHYAAPGRVSFEITTSQDPLPKAADYLLFSRSVTDFYPEASTYAVSAAAEYRFSFTAMETITTDKQIAITFPAGMIPETLETLEADKVTINDDPAATVVVDGNKLFVTASSPLASFTTVDITIAEDSGIRNPASPGFYTLEIKPEGSALPAVRRIGFIPAEGSSLNDAGHGSLEPGGEQLRFFFPAHTILKGGDTITIASPEGTLLTEEDITIQDIYIESPPMDNDGSDEIFHPASLERTAGNELTFTLPEGYYLEPDYSFGIRIPNVIADQPGKYVFTIATSQETIPLAFSIMNDSLAMRLSDSKKSQIDGNNDGLHMDDILRFIGEGEDLDMNGDGEFNEEDMRILLASIDPLSER